MSNYRVSTDLRGHTVVDANMACINGLSAWVMVADLGKPEPEDEMFGGFDREAIGNRIVKALSSESRIAVTVPAAPVCINGLTEAETSATASVMGVVGMQAPGVGGPTYYVRHPDETYSVADPQPTSVARGANGR